MKFDPIACLKTRSVWRLILAVSAGSLAVWVLNLLMGENGSVSLLILSVLSLFTWVLTIRLMLLDSWLKIFWILWLTGGICLLVFLRDTIGIVLALSFSFIFLLFRRYKPYQSLSSRRKAALFLLALLMFFLLSLGFVSIGETASESGEARSLVSILFSIPGVLWFYSGFLAWFIFFSGSACIL